MFSLQVRKIDFPYLIESDLWDTLILEKVKPQHKLLLLPPSTPSFFEQLEFIEEIIRPFSTQQIKAPDK
jgi:hypothetical protein